MASDFGLRELVEMSGSSVARNKARDREVTRTLKQSGWRVLRVWEWALSRRRSTATVRRIARAVAARVDH